MKGMKTYRVHLIWSLYGHVDIEAKSAEEAVEIALGPDCPLPEGEYIDDSVQVDELVGVEDLDQLKGANENKWH